MSAINFGNNANFNQNEALFFVLQKLGSDPSTPVEGQMYFNTNIGRVKIYTGGQWLILEASTGSSTTIDDIVAGNQIAVSITGGVATIAHGSITGASNTNFTGASVLASLTFNNGHVTGVTTRNLTLANLGFTGASDADKYTSWQIGADIGANQNVESNQAVKIDGEGGIITEMKTGRVVEIRPDATFVRTTGAQNIEGNKTFKDNVIVEGNLTVTGSTVTSLGETVTLEDSIILLNKGASGPANDAGFVVDRGSGTNKALVWDEGQSAFVIADVGTFTGATGTVTIDAYANMIIGILGVEKLIISDAPTAVTPITIYVKDGSGNVAEITPANLWAAIQVAATSSVAGITRYATNAEAVARTASNRALTPANLSALRFQTNVGNGTATFFDLTHNLNSVNVNVVVFDNSNDERWIVAYKANNANSTRVEFGFAPSNNQFRVIITLI